MEPIVWGMLLVVILVIEIAVPGPTALWFGAGTLVGGLVSFCGGELWIQCIAFCITSIIVAMALRPIMKKWKETPHEKTNVDALIGKIVPIIETIDNYEETGMAVVDGNEWTARSIDEEIMISKGEFGIIKEIRGVKLILEPIEKKM